MSAFEAKTSTNLPFPSSPHCAPTTEITLLIEKSTIVSEFFSIDLSKIFWSFEGRVRKLDFNRHQSSFIRSQMEEISYFQRPLSVSSRETVTDVIRRLTFKSRDMPLKGRSGSGWAQHLLLGHVFVIHSSISSLLCDFVCGVNPESYFQNFRKYIVGTTLVQVSVISLFLLVPNSIAAQ